ncbi:uncharacterized protein LOC133184845 [Saccostrea echinata]|uniref:uncharacterized protein LOC133184845 n=1 Tax=Saccostrea echinata TaxID=191078 RepID=UPI002A841846|nr:uncharacterized protein LOC133184845 [Saccostrea echinata]
MSSDRNISVIPLAKAGFVDGGNYETYRPGYTDDVVKEIILMATDSVDLLDGECEYDILELGAGTGKFTECLLKHCPQGMKVLVTEPSNDFIKTLEEKIPVVETRQCSANKIPLPDNSVKAIIAAQCFHWFANEENISEIARVLKPGGNFVLVWNVLDESSLLNADFQKFILKWIKDSPQYYDMRWKQFLDNCDQQWSSNCSPCEEVWILIMIMSREERSFEERHPSNLK